MAGADTLAAGVFLMFNYPVLQELARIYTGKKVRVWALPTWETAGAIADYRDGFRIGLHPNMRLAGVKALAHAFLHECGHIALGHVWAGNPPEGAVGLPECEAMLDTDPAGGFAAKMKAYFEQNDREADAWADEHMPGLEEVWGDDLYRAFLV